MSTENHAFQAEVSRLLDIVAHSLYSNREIFLRELISNASDACDKLRYLALTDAELLPEGEELKVELAVSSKSITVTDNGIGMSHDELIENLGTIARSGTGAFLDQIEQSGDGKADTSLIGQFGVGFYSAFMVADQVAVTSRKAGETTAHTWTSDGKGEFTVDSAPEDTPRGTKIVLTIKKDAKEFLDRDRLRHIVKAYSDHIALPIVLTAAKKDEDDERLNEASALWARSKSDITEDQYREFYHHVGHAFDEPWITLHNRQEGVIEYTNLLFVPKTPPFDLFHPERRRHVKLYVRRVFITDDNEDLLPGWLRFMRGIVDSEDLPLNISREMLQHNPVLAKIRRGVVKRIIAALKRKADKEPQEYEEFWSGFGPVIKEGLYEDQDNKDTILELTRFRASETDGWTSLAAYVEAMPETQDAIYTIAGDDIATLRNSPQLEAFKAKGINVLLLADPIDEFWVPTVGVYQEKPFKSITRGDIDLNTITKDDDAEADDDKQDEAPDISALTAMFKLELKDAVKDVRASHRLTDSAVCLVADEGDLDMHLERLMRAHKQTDETSPRILELNPTHPLIKSLAESVTKEGAKTPITDVAHLLLDQARILEGEPLPDPAAFSRRLTAALRKGLAV